MPEVQYSLCAADETLPDGGHYRHTWEILSVLNPDAGPCVACGKATVRLDTNQHVDHNGYQYIHHINYVYAHADGSEHHGRMARVQPQAQCPECKRYGSVTTKQQAYGDLTRCAECGWEHWYDIGD